MIKDIKYNFTKGAVLVTTTKGTVSEFTAQNAIELFYFLEQDAIRENPGVPVEVIRANPQMTEQEIKDFIEKKREAEAVDAIARRLAFTWLDVHKPKADKEFRKAFVNDNLDKFRPLAQKQREDEKGLVL